MRSLVKFLTLVDMLDQGLARGGVKDLPEAGDEIAAECFRIGLLDAASDLSSFEVEEDLAEVPLRVGAGPRPVDVSP